MTTTLHALADPNLEALKRIDALLAGGESGPDAMADLLSDVAEIVRKALIKARLRALNEQVLGRIERAAEKVAK